MIKGDRLIRKFEIALVLVTPDRRQMRRQKAVLSSGMIWGFFSFPFFLVCFLVWNFCRREKR